MRETYEKGPDLLCEDVESPAWAQAREAGPVGDFSQLEGEELRELRTEMGKQYDLGEGRYQAVLFSQPVHYRKAGAWEEIDNGLEETRVKGRRVLKNRANALRCEWPMVPDGGPLVTLKCRRATLSWSFEADMEAVAAEVKSGRQLNRERLMELARSMQLDAEKMTDEELAKLETAEDRRRDVPATSSEVTYRGILPGVDARYTLSGDQVKEDIVCHNKGALTRVAIKLPGEYDYRVMEDKGLSIRDRASGEELFTFGEPVVYDAAGQTIVAEPMLEPMEGYTRLTYLLDPEFVAAAVYPITIDPVVRKRSGSD